MEIFEHFLVYRIVEKYEGLLCGNALPMTQLVIRFFIVKIVLNDVQFKICIGLLQVSIQLKFDGSHEAVPRLLGCHILMLWAQRVDLDKLLYLTSHVAVVANSN